MDHEKWLEQHDQMMADFDQKLAAAREDHDREMKEIRGLVRSVGQVLRRAIRDGIREARNERARRRRVVAEIDDQITKLSAAQLITEEELQQLIERDEQRYGANGNPPAAQ
jgi:hypothetical protein